MIRKTIMLLCILAVVSAMAACGCSTGSETAQTSSSKTVTVEPTKETTPEPTKEAAPTATPTPTPTPTPTKKPTPTPTATPTPTPEPSKKPTPTPTPKPAEAPKVTADPTDETVEEGGSCLYIAKADNADSMIWHFVSPEGKTDVAYNAIGTYFPKLTVEGGESENLTLSTIPLDFNGWKSYCEFTGKGGKAKSGTATTTVNAKPTPEPTKEPTPEPTPEPTKEPTPEPTPEPEDVYAGTYYEETAGRGEMVIEQSFGGDAYMVTITWASSADESTQWTFSGEFDGRGKMKYTNCVRTDTYYNYMTGETEEEVVWTDGKGKLQMTDEGAEWSDKHKENGKTVTFLRDNLLG